MTLRAALLTLSLATLVCAADLRLGKPLTLDHPESVAHVLASAGSLAGKTVQVSGTVTEVCEAMGCWMSLTDGDGRLLRIKVDDGVIVFPKDAVGKNAVAEGKLEKLELTREQVIAEAKHEAEEQHRRFDASKIKSGRTVYQIAGTGAIIGNQ